MQAPFRIFFKHFSFYINSLIIQHQIKMTGYIKKPHTAIFIAQTGCGKTHLVLELIEKEYNKHFDYIVVMCLTIRENDAYHAKGGLKTTIMFGFEILRIIFTNGLKSCQNCYDYSKYYS